MNWLLTKIEVVSQKRRIGKKRMKCQLVYTSFEFKFSFMIFKILISLTEKLFLVTTCRNIQFSKN